MSTPPYENLLYLLQRPLYVVNVHVLVTVLLKIPNDHPVGGRRAREGLAIDAPINLLLLPATGVAILRASQRMQIK